MPATPRWLRLHAGISDLTHFRRCAHPEDLWRHERDHEDPDRALAVSEPARQHALRDPLKMGWRLKVLHGSGFWCGQQRIGPGWAPVFGAPQASVVRLGDTF